MSTGAAVPSMTTAILNSLEIEVPPDDLRVKFDMAVEPMFAQKRLLKKQNAALATARDLLLPRLMKGDIMRLDMSDTDTTRCESRVHIPPFPNRGCVSDFGGAL